MGAATSFVHEPDPDRPGWHTWQVADDTLFNAVALGRLVVRREGDRGVRLRLPQTLRRHANVNGAIHGGVTMTLADSGIFATTYLVSGPQTSGAVTLDFNCHFTGRGMVGQPLDFAGELMQETGRLAFVRGTVEQGDRLIATIMATLRKPSVR